jgi:hypothetical protein
MNFLRAASGVLIALWDIKRIFTVECADQSTRCVATLRNDELVELSRDYTIEALRRALDPVRASR